MDVMDHAISTAGCVRDAPQDFLVIHVHFTVASDAQAVISQLVALSVIWVIMDQHVKMLVLCVRMAVTS